MKVPEEYKRDENLNGPRQEGSQRTGRPALGAELEEEITRNSVVGSFSPDQGNPYLDTGREHRTPPSGPFPIPEKNRP